MTDNKIVKTEAELLAEIEHEIQNSEEDKALNNAANSDIAKDILNEAYDLEDYKEEQITTPKIPSNNISSNNNYHQNIIKIEKLGTIKTNKTIKTICICKSGIINKKTTINIIYQ